MHNEWTGKPYPIKIINTGSGAESFHTKYMNPCVKKGFPTHIVQGKASLRNFDCQRFQIPSAAKIANLTENIAKI
jgi:hypothetical protein